MRCNMTSLVRYWCQHHIMPWALVSASSTSMVLLYFLGLDDQNEVQHDFFVLVAPLTLALSSHNADRMINGRKEVQYNFSGLCFCIP